MPVVSAIVQPLQTWFLSPCAWSSRPSQTGVAGSMGSRKSRRLSMLRYESSSARTNQSALLSEGGQPGLRIEVVGVQVHPSVLCLAPEGVAAFGFLEWRAHHWKVGVSCRREVQQYVAALGPCPIDSHRASLHFVRVGHDPAKDALWACYISTARVYKDECTTRPCRQTYWSV